MDASKQIQGKIMHVNATESASSQLSFHKGMVREQIINAK
jgi:hypothetical protein